MAPAYEDMLRGAGLRVTRPRTAVLAVLEHHPHSDSAAVFDAVRADLPTVSRQAVYDCLAALSGAGLVRRIQPAGSSARYELRVGDNHHHLVCRSCGAVVDTDCADSAAPCLHPTDDHGFAIDEAEVIFWGLCPACSSSPTTTQHHTKGS